MAPVVVCVGLTTFDLVQRVAALPGPNQKVAAEQQWYDVGGPAANAARVAAALGCRVRLVTALGTGPFAELAARRLTGIEIVELAGAGHRLPVSAIAITPDGARSVISRNAAGAQVAPPGTGVVRDADVVLHDGHLLAASVRLGAQHRPIQLLDGGSWKPGLERLLPSLDIAVVSADFAFPGGTPEQALDRLSAHGIPRLARSAGADPVELRIAGHPNRRLPVPQVAVVDTLGAGDVLHGALAARLARGRDFTTALGEAIRLASRSVAGRGLTGVLAELTAPGESSADRRSKHRPAGPPGPPC